MNLTLRRRYPDDEEFGKKWLEAGRRIEWPDENGLSLTHSDGYNIHA